MKNHKITRFTRLSALIIVLALAITSYCPGAGRTVKAAELANKALTTDSAAVTADQAEIRIGESYAIDPATLNVKKLGQDEADSEPEVILPSDKYDLDDIVRVSIFMEQASVVDAGYSLNNVAADREILTYREALKAAQIETVNRISEKLRYSIDVKWHLTLTANAVSAYVKYGDIVKIASVSGVKKVVLEAQYEPPKDVQPDGTASPLTANTSENMTGAQQAWEDGYTGAGSKIAIIDTGADTDHQSFNADAFDYAISTLGKTVTLMTSRDVDTIKSRLNGSGGKYLSSKIPFVYNYVDGNTTVDHVHDTEGEHGSHVAGIATANRYIKSGSSYVVASDTVGAVGMAPDAQLIIMKVFGAGGGAYDSDYMAAIDDAILLGCDAVNLSLGSSVQGFTFDSEYQNILNKLADKELNNKLVVSISAGNSYALTEYLETDLYIEDVHMHTGGSPGTYVNSLCVAAANNTLTTGCPLVFNGSQEVFYAESTEGDDGTAYTNHKMTTISGSYSYVYIDALGKASDYSAVNSAVSLSGKIVIVNRGELAFSDKGNNAKSYSPKAVVVANNDRGTILMNLSDFTGTFPMVSIKLDDALMIKQNASSSGTVNGQQL